MSTRFAHRAVQLPSQTSFDQRACPATEPSPPQLLQRSIRTTRAALLWMAAALLALVMVDPAAAQALQPVVRSATIIRDTVVAIALIVMTIAIGVAGFKIAFSGASFRDVSNLVVGGAMAGGAAAIAAIFMA